MTKQSIVVATMALVLGATIGVAGLQTVSAAENSGNTLIENLARKFNTTTDEVKGVFESTKAEKLEEVKKDQQAALDQAEKDGKITADQKNTILGKMQNIDSKMEAVRTAHEDLRTWAQDNNVDLREIMPMRKMMLHHGPGKLR